MTGNEWMFYLSGAGLLLLLTVYAPIRIWLIVKKQKIRNKLKEEMRMTV